MSICGYQNFRIMKKTRRTKPASDDYKTSSAISLITNYKRRGMFEARLVESKTDKKDYVYLKIGKEDFYIDLEENEILPNLFSEKEMAGIIENLIIENLRLESNLRIASDKLTPQEYTVLDLAARGQSTKGVSSKTGLSRENIEICKKQICQKLKKGSLEELICFLREKKLQ